MQYEPDSIRAAIWAQLTAAAEDKTHPWRIVALASSNLNGAATVRSVILREVDAANSQLVFYTDKRSAKCHQITERPEGELLFWHPVLQWQLRAVVDYQLLTNGPRVERLWQQLSVTSAASDYLSEKAPGTVLLSPEVAVSAKPNLAIIIAQVREFDWLALSKLGHKRALLTADEFHWRVP
ncbi:MAG: pyridoxamine 5'-phosphate oxidase family protein [Methylophaga sp.]